MNRRQFVAASAASVLPVAGANERLQGAVIGCGGRGTYLLKELQEIGAEIRAICEVYEPRLQAAVQLTKGRARGYLEYRDLLQDPSIDFVVVATPDHWHAQMVIDSVLAGKDVYVEKPLAHTIEEGFRIVEAVKRTGRVVQVGTQRRSFDLFIEAYELLKDNPIGPVRLVNSWWYNHQGSLRQSRLQGKLDWERWLGPAPKRPLDPVRYFNWYYFWDYSGGLMVGQAAHIIDAINWFMGSTFPLAVTCAATKPNLEGAEVPETTCMCVEYPENFLAVFTCGYKAMRYAPINDQCKQFNGSEARFDVGREFYAYYPQSRDEDLRPLFEKRRPGSFASATRAHLRNFLECVRTRQQPNATVEMGNWTNVTLCLAMEALRKGQRLKWNANERRIEYPA